MQKIFLSDAILSSVAHTTSPPYVSVQQVSTFPGTAFSEQDETGSAMKQKNQHNVQLDVQEPDIHRMQVWLSGVMLGYSPAAASWAPASTAKASRYMAVSGFY